MAICKRAIHTILRRFGLDLITVKNFEAEVAKRVKSRQEAAAEESLKLREVSKVVNDLQRVGTVQWVSREHLMLEAARHIIDVEVVLDIGCAFKPQKFIDAKIHICCEPFVDYMDRLIAEYTSQSEKFVFINADISRVCELFPARSVDTVFMMDVIEHIPQDVARESLKCLLTIARHQVVVFTPLGFMDQQPGADGRDQWGMAGSEWQKHRSGWTPEDFLCTQGWSIIGCRDYHLVDGYGRPIAEPVGAFWAIWNRD